MVLGTEPEANLTHAAEMVNEAATRGAEVICLPELFRSRYFCQREDAALFDLAESIPGRSTEVLGAIAHERQVVILAPLFERRAPGVYHNSVAVLDSDGQLAGIYRKMHIPDDPSYYEKFYFTPGDLGFKAFETRYGRLAPLICWDQWYPEAARLAALRGACILFYPTAIGWHPREKRSFGDAQRDGWITIQRSHAIANGLYVAAANRVGLERPDDGGDGIEFWGSSFLCDPFGTILTQAPVDEEAILISEVDLTRIEETRRGWPFLRDRRVDAYGEITRRLIDTD